LGNRRPAGEGYVRPAVAGPQPRRTVGLAGAASALHGDRGAGGGHRGERPYHRARL